MNDLHHPCENWAEAISLAAAGCLSPDEEREVRGHIETCSHCREHFQQLTKLCGGLAGARLSADGAENAVVERILSAVNAQVSQRPAVGARAKTIRAVLFSRSFNTWRWIMHSPVSRIAAAAILILGIVGAALWLHSAGAPFAFADFVAPILEAHTVRYKTTTEVKGPPAWTVTSENMVLDATRTRIEVDMPNKSKEVITLDVSQGKQLCLNSADKTATVLTFPPRKRTPDDKDPFAGYRSLLVDARDKPGLKREPLGEKLLDGRPVVGFRITAEDGRTFDLWGDPKTGQAVRVEMSMGVFSNMKVTMSDLVFNAEMDESLFSVEPPPGYTVRHEKVDNSPDEEKDLIGMFREYTKLTSGAFPESLDPMKVSGTYWMKYNNQSMWDHLQAACEDIAPGAVKADEAQKQKFDDRMTAIMNRIQENVMQGKPYDAETREMRDEILAVTFSTQWQAVAPAKLRANEMLRRKFEERMRKASEGESGDDVGQKTAAEFGKIMIELRWEDLAPEKVKDNEELRHKFEELAPKIIDEKLNESEMPKIKEEFRAAFGADMLKGVEAWQAELQKNKEAQEARHAEMQKNAESAEAREQKFMDAQRQVSRGVNFANQLPPDADAHYAGKGVSVGAANTPIFWYRPKDSKNYRVIYADLSVHESDAPPSTPAAESPPAAAGSNK